MKDKKTIKSNIPNQFSAYGYIRKDEEGGYTAICVNLSLFAQGNTVDKSLKKLINSIISYLTNVAKNHPEEWVKLTNRPVPSPLMKEYKSIIDEIKKTTPTAKTKYSVVKPVNAKVREASKQRTSLPNLSFVQQISTSNAQASL